MTIIDIRTDKPMGTIKAHEGSLCAISVSSKVPNMVVTASEDEIAKIWDLNTATTNPETEEQSILELVFEKTLRIVRCKISTSKSGSEFKNPAFFSF